MKIGNEEQDDLVRKLAEEVGKARDRTPLSAPRLIGSAGHLTHADGNRLYGGARIFAGGAGHLTIVRLDPFMSVVVALMPRARPHAAPSPIEERLMDLHTAGHRRGVVAAPHHAAAETGRAILGEGGNALEAMVAMAATIAAVYPHMNHVGGDGFFLVRERSGRVRALMAAGRAGAKARIELYRAEGYDTIPERGPLAALTVPGAVAGWMLALEAAKAQGGRMPLATLLEAAIRHARDGYAVTRSQARLTAEKQAEFRESARLCRDLPGRWQAARGRNRAAAGGAGGDARSSRQGRARRFLSRRRRPRDRRRSRTDRQPGDPRRPRSRPRRGGRSAEPDDRGRHAS